MGVGDPDGSTVARCNAGVLDTSTAGVEDLNTPSAAGRKPVQKRFGYVILRDSRAIAKIGDRPCHS